MFICCKNIWILKKHTSLFCLRNCLRSIFMRGKMIQGLSSWTVTPNSFITLGWLNFLITITLLKKSCTITVSNSTSTARETRVNDNLKPCSVYKSSCYFIFLSFTAAINIFSSGQKFSAVWNDSQQKNLCNSAPKPQQVHLESFFLQITLTFNLLHMKFHFLLTFVSPQKAFKGVCILS